MQSRGETEERSDRHHRDKSSRGGGGGEGKDNVKKEEDEQQQQVAKKKKRQEEGEEAVVPSILSRITLPPSKAKEEAAGAVAATAATAAVDRCTCMRLLWLRCFVVNSCVRSCGYLCRCFCFESPTLHLSCMNRLRDNIDLFLGSVVITRSLRHGTNNEEGRRSKGLFE